MATIAAILDFTQKMAELKLFHTTHVEYAKTKNLAAFCRCFIIFFSPKKVKKTHYY